MAKPVKLDHGGEDVYGENPDQQPSSLGFDAQFTTLKGDMAAIEAVGEITIEPPQWPDEPSTGGPTKDIQDLFSGHVRVMDSLSAIGRGQPPRRPAGQGRRPHAVKHFDITPTLEQGPMAPEQAEARGFEVPEGFAGPETLPDFRDLMDNMLQLAQSGREGRFALTGRKTSASTNSPKTDFSKQTFPEGDPQENQAEAEANALSAGRLNLERQLRWMTEVTELLHEHSLRIDDLVRQLERDRD